MFKASTAVYDVGLRKLTSINADLNKLAQKITTKKRNYKGAIIMILIETENDSHSKHEATNSCGLSILAASRDVPNVISSLLCPGTAALYVSPDL